MATLNPGTPDGMPMMRSMGKEKRDRGADRPQREIRVGLGLTSERLLKRIRSQPETMRKMAGGPPPT